MSAATTTYHHPLGTAGGGHGIPPPAPPFVISLSSKVNMCSLSSPVSAAASLGAGGPSSRESSRHSVPHCSPLLLSKKRSHCFSSAISGYNVAPGSGRAMFLPSRAMDMFASECDEPENVNLSMAIDSLRRLWSRCPEPVKRFPWLKAATSFYQLVFDLLVHVAKCLCIPVLGLSSLSEMSYCAHERKMAVIPIPFLAGIAVAKVLKEAAVELSPDLKDLEFPFHLLVIAAFFILMKLPGPYYPYWGRLSIPHFANGGLWSLLWFALRYRRPQSLATKNTGTSELQH